jgi:hypothetical protein
MKLWMNATSIRRLTVLGSLASMTAFSCSPAGKDSMVNSSNGTAATAANGGASTTGGSHTGSGGLSLPGDIPKEMPAGPCKGLACAVQACSGAPKTTITGKVYDPAGKVPLYNVLVYVPNEPVKPFTEGATCDRCDASVVNPVTSAVTDETGSFVLTDAPVGANIPLVIQVGKWRRQLVIPAVNACADNPLMDPQMMRLPRNKMEGDIPRIAITVGAADQMECLPLRMGIDPAEFTTSAGDGRIHLYEGNNNGTRLPVTQFDAMHNGGAKLTSVDQFWNSKDNLMKYDLVILSCEGDDKSFRNQKPMPYRQAMYDYASAGGRVFASHWHNIWFSQGPQPVPTTGTWTDRADPTAMGAAITATINQTFPKGAALAKWLVNVQASTTLGTMMVDFPRDNLQTINPMVARDWITVQNPNVNPGDQPGPTATEYMSFNAPIGAADDKICGRAVYTDLHVASVDTMNTSNSLGFPASCVQRDMSAQEKAVAFMLFDLSACIMNEAKAPKPPK